MRKFIAVVFLTAGLLTAMALMNRADATDWQYVAHNSKMRVYLDMDSLTSEVLGGDIIRTINAQFTTNKPPYIPMGEDGHFIWLINIDCTHPYLAFIMPNSANLPDRVESGEIPLKGYLGSYLLGLCGS